MRKKRLDRGRILTLVLLEKQVSCWVDVRVGNRVYPNRLLEFPIPVSNNRVVHFFGLRSVKKDLNLFPYEVDVESHSSKDEMEDPFVDGCQNDMDTLPEKVRSHYYFSDKEEEKGGEEQRIRNGLKAKEAFFGKVKHKLVDIGGEIRDGDKGKCVWCRKPKSNPRQAGELQCPNGVSASQCREVQTEGVNEAINSSMVVSSISKKSKGKKREFSLKIHPMKTRSSILKIGQVRDIVGNSSRKGRVVWNSKEEITKVIEKGVVLGLNLKYRSSVIRKANQLHEGLKDSDVIWDLEEEITKVLETGAALSFDFNGKENEIIE
ncbi:hypothetical protein Q3G72_028490 [Acer saccharum]|nr:hypothetical protein Q3G72_028490 [Acer saccharum]